MFAHLRTAYVWRSMMPLTPNRNKFLNLPVSLRFFASDINNASSAPRFENRQKHDRPSDSQNRRDDRWKRPSKDGNNVRSNNSWNFTRKTRSGGGSKFGNGTSEMRESRRVQEGGDNDDGSLLQYRSKAPRPFSARDDRRSPSARDQRRSPSARDRSFTSRDRSPRDFDRRPRSNSFDRRGNNRNPSELRSRSAERDGQMRGDREEVPRKKWAPPNDGRKRGDREDIPRKKWAPSNGSPKRGGDREEVTRKKSNDGPKRGDREEFPRKKWVSTNADRKALQKKPTTQRKPKVKVEPNRDAEKYEHRPVLPPDQARFDMFGISKELIENLRANEIVSPSAIQQRAIPEILEGKDVLLAAETGSGKTLTYVLPLLEKLRSTRKSSTPKESVEEEGDLSPDALIIVPSQELVAQVSQMILAVAKETQIGVATLLRHQTPQLTDPPCILVATPGLLESLEQKQFFSKTKYVVVDEADFLLGGSFGKPISALLKTLKTRSPTGGLKRDAERQFVFAAATVPVTGDKTVLNWFQKKEHALFGKTLFVSTEGLHKTIPTLKQEFISLPNEPDSATPNQKRFEKLLEILKQAKSEKCLVFVNTVQMAKEAQEFLSAHQIPIKGIHKDLETTERLTNLQQFRSGQISALICTDLAARGLDIPLIDTIIQLEFPRNVVDYLHRTGRTARMGASGKVLSFVTEKDKALCDAIQKNFGSTMQPVFSRKRGFRRRIRKMTREEMKIMEEDE